MYYLRDVCHPPILHGDLKPLNIFIHEDGRLKLGDFGAATLVKGLVKGNKHATQFLTQCYSSPERLQSKSYACSSDMWSLGCILYELTHMKRAFGNDAM